MRGRPATRYSRLLISVLALALLGVPARSRAETSCVSPGEGDGAAAARRWTPPLDTAISIEARDLTLRDALDRVAAAARVRLSYSTDLLPLDRSVCFSYDTQPLGDILVALLAGTDLEPVVADGGFVVLAPRTPGSLPAPAYPRALRVGMLERVVVTGTGVGVPARPLTVAMDVITGRELAERDATSLARALDAVVPGLWVWEQSPASFGARYGSLRGASSFGASAPKIYVDGIEVANPLLITQLSPQGVDRVEVVRGPQGAALYGADAIGGVVNIVMRHRGVDDDEQHLSIQSSAGLTQSAFAEHPVLMQDDALTLRGGTAERSENLSLGIQRTGDYVPGAHSQQLSADAGVRLLGARSTVLGSARFFAGDAGAPINPLLQGFTSPVPGYGFSAARHEGGALEATRASASPTPGGLLMMDDREQSLREYTLGGTALLAQNDHWTHALTLGLDGYRLSNVPDDALFAPSAFDDALRRARGGADRGTLRLATTARLGSEDAASSAFTLAVDHSTLRDASRALLATHSSGADAPRPAGQPLEATWENTTGLTAEANSAFHDLLYLTTGLRLERFDDLGAGSETAALPRLGGAVVKDFGGLTVKLRTSYGRAVRTPRTALRDLALQGIAHVTTPAGLAPESQAGTETGLDLAFAGIMALHLTHYDQRATGLLQPVASSAGFDPSGGAARTVYGLQNVGRIANRGWELQSSVTLSRLTLQGAASLVDSRVKQIADGYTGDLRPGDRMLGVPARTASATALWTGTRWSTAWTLSRASQWMDYDRLAIANALLTTAAAPLGGTSLRDYWRAYPGVTRLGFTFTRDLRSGLALRFAADNLLNQQRGEPDNITVLPGRTVSLGLRAAF